MSALQARRTLCAVGAALACLAAPAPAAGGEIEVLHFWTSDGETGALAKLKASLRQQGHTWRDFTVNNGGNGLAMTMLRSRVASDNPPTAAQIKGIAIQEWARSGKLAGIDEVARADQWDQLLPRSVSATMKYQGRYVAAPMNVHRVNWLWINAEVLKKANAKVPTTWDEFFAVAEAIRQAGVIPVAYVGQSWLNLGRLKMSRWRWVAKTFTGAPSSNSIRRRSPARPWKRRWKPTSASSATPIRRRPSATGSAPPPWWPRARPACS
ncbi:ABC transporter substrate-binding protein [Duganella radicis]|uniref:ABC transporter substrate-binding protein n=1 Tax=Duganella radicis TaxID=551988 RepID=UPI00281105AB|nr:ABC transporter substrate-binding protein [Duganella radicis]